MKTQEFSWHGSSNVRIFAQEWRPEGEVRAALGLIHGVGEHIGHYQNVVSQLTLGGYALVGFDLPGFGRSGGQRGFCSFVEISREIDHLLFELGKRFPGKPHFLYGHSMGGALVLYHILKCRPNLRGAIICSPALALGQPPAPVKRMAAMTLASLLPRFSLSNGLDIQNLSHDQVGVVQAYQKDPLVTDRVTARLGRDVFTQGEWILAHAQTFPVPMLLMQGSADHIVSVAATDRLARVVPANLLTYRIWEGLYHELHNETEREQVLRTMQDWLDKQSEN